MKREKRQLGAQPAHVRAPANLLAVCDMGMDSPDPEARVVYALLAKVIQRTAERWGADGPSDLDIELPEAAAVAGRR